jgi:hypothetical protein
VIAVGKMTAGNTHIIVAAMGSYRCSGSVRFEEKSEFELRRVGKRKAEEGAHLR